MSARTTSVKVTTELRYAPGQIVLAAEHDGQKLRPHELSHAVQTADGYGLSVWAIRLRMDGTPMARSAYPRVLWTLTSHGDVDGALDRWVGGA